MTRTNTLDVSLALVTPGKLVFPTQGNDANRNATPWRIGDPESWDQDVTPSMFVMVSENTGCRQYALFTGRTARIFGLDCPTVERFEIDTVATTGGAIMAQVGARIPGTFAVRPDAVLFLA